MPNVHFIEDEHLMEHVKNKFLQLLVKNSVITTMMPPCGKNYDFFNLTVAYPESYIRRTHDLEAKYKK